jgi:predicted dehydrogenase
VSGSRLLGGEPEAVHGEQHVGATGVDTTFVGELRFPGDLIAVFHVSMEVLPRQELEVLGSEGTLLAHAPWRVDLGGDLLVTRGDRVELIDVAAADSYRLELEDLAAAVRGERAPLLGREDALGQAHTIDALYRSADEGGTIQLEEAP